MAIKIGIIGYGFVGKAAGNGFKKKGCKVKYYDKFKKSSSRDNVVEFADYIFICLPTPSTKSGLDLSIIDEELKEITKLTDRTNKIIVIKSTVLPKTTFRYAKKYPKSNFCFNPEFLTEKNYLQDFLNADRTVIGVENSKVKAKMIKLYKKTFPRVPILVMKTAEAEMVKYTANCLLATKVSFANEIFKVCRKLKLNYNAVKDGVIADKRIGKTHLDISKERGFGGKCFPKDIVALMSEMKRLKIDNSVLKAVWKKNLMVRKIHDWEKIPGALSLKNQK